MTEGFAEQWPAVIVAELTRLVGVDSQATYA